ncbi:MAG: tetratricopeptide repeat protein [Pseudomonadota bacterium]
MKKEFLFLSAVSTAALVCLYPAGGLCGKDADLEKAKLLFLEATEYYNEGMYAKAVIKFHDTYDLSPQPELLFNIAVCYEELNQTGSAIEYYRKYLEENPDTEDKAAIEKKIAKLESGDTSEEEDEEVKESGTKKLVGKIKKLVMPEDEGDMPPMRASWMHGLRIVLGGHLSNEAKLKYKSPAWSIEAGYDIRFKQGKASLSLKAGYGQIIDATKAVQYHLIPITGAFGWEVWQYKARVIQLLFGGIVKFDADIAKRATFNAFFIGAGPVVDFIWNTSSKFGIKIGFSTFAGYATYVPHWGVGFNINLGIVLGLK